MPLVSLRLLLLLALSFLPSTSTVSAFAVYPFAPSLHRGQSSSNLFINQKVTRFEADKNSACVSSGRETIKILKASLLIAGTTVGGGFLALPQTVVVPLGGFIPSAASLFVVWAYLLVQSFILASCLIECHKSNTRETTDDDVVGIPFAARQALGVKGSVAATTLLIVLTEATLVSQLSRAGLLVAESFGGSYRLGCVAAAMIGAFFSFGGGLKKVDDSNDDSDSLASNSNALLTTLFIVSAGLLFQAGSKTAQWVRCFESSSDKMFALGPIAKATPTMLQLLVYGEILPNVCRMLDYDTKSVRRSLLFGSFIPLTLLTGWAGLGVALLPPAMTGVIKDPVNVLLQTGTRAVKQRLLLLAISAIGTTVLGSYLALESAYKDVSQMTLQSRPAAKRFIRNPLVSALAIALPPLAISVISPTLFLKSIDFAGSYPVLLLYGVIPPLMALRMRAKSKSRRQVLFFVMSCILSGGMVLASAIPDVWAMVSLAWTGLTKKA